MAESSACLLRSYSQPFSSSPQTQQGVPFRCLTSSISFGRYMTETLDWEKWSAFTENRYMEDVKKYSRPGSVAQMKAHFEAHYKRKAAERAEALLEQQNANCISRLDQDLMQMDNHVARERRQEEEVTRNEVTESVEVSRRTPPCGERRKPEGAYFVEAEENQLKDQVDISNSLETAGEVQESGCELNTDRSKRECTQFPKVQSPLTSDQVDVCGQLKSTEDNGKGEYHEDGKTQCKGTGELGDPAFSEKRKSVFSRFISRGQHNGVPKPPAPPNPSIPIQKRQSTKGNSGSRENTADVENRKAKTRSLHMSIDHAQKETKKQLSPVLQRLLNSRLVKTLAGKAAQASSQATQATQGKPLRDTVDIPAHPPVSLQQRKFTSKSPRTCSRIVQSPTVSRPFIFKSEERAEKRKEFFESLVQNSKAKETEKGKVQENLKVKARNDFKYMHLATSNVGPGSHSFRLRTPNDATKIPCSALVREDVKDNDARPPWRPIASCKEMRGKNNHSAAFSLKSASKKSSSENASPNIQLW